tara:strand:- start:39888 stop:42080 length:2193 start_codon:yes stop_codon:yes gene_type:complete
MRDVDLVVPVYDGYVETRACIQSVLDTVTQAWARIILINDCSPSPEITRYLQQVAQQRSDIVLLENEQNLGFVATVNRGMGYAKDRDVVLLNSDVEVAGDWLSRLREAAYANPGIGSITPFANNATICSFPDFCSDNDLVFGLPLATIDATFSQLFSATDVFDIPTGVGCCLYLSRDCLDAVGVFDVETFGRGYGEENDWCQRAITAGWRNVHLANVFVYHKGGVSFGIGNDQRIARAQEILDQKYPRYHSDVQSFIAEDPARAMRTSAWLALFAAQDMPKLLMVSHKLGGGAQQHVDELAALYKDRALSLQLMPHEDGESVTLTCFDGPRRFKDGLFFDINTEYDKLVALLQELGIGRVHIHHTMGLHPRLWRIAADLECEYDLTVHDYYLLNGNPTITDRDARYVSTDRKDFDDCCAQHYPLPAGIVGGQWRHNQRLLVEGAQRVIFPSGDCAVRFQAFFSVAQAIVAWHPDYALSQPYPEPRWDFNAQRPLKVLAIGALSREKGADVLESVAVAMAEEQIEFHLLGYAYRALDSRVISHGAYENAHVENLVARIAPDVVWYPALWPETYSYTLSIALHNGLPVVVPDIGAFRERVDGRALSVVMPWNTSVAEWATFWNAVLGSQRLVAATTRAGALPAADVHFYESDYLKPVPSIRGEASKARLDSLMANLYAQSGGLSRSERLLASLWGLSRRPLVARMVSLVPFRLQRAVKRRLSARPMHDIVRK